MRFIIHGRINEDLNAMCFCHEYSSDSVLWMFAHRDRMRITYVFRKQPLSGQPYILRLCISWLCSCNKRRTCSNLSLNAPWNCSIFAYRSPALLLINACNGYSRLVCNTQKRVGISSIWRICLWNKHRLYTYTRRERLISIRKKKVNNNLSGNVFIFSYNRFLSLDRISVLLWKHLCYFGKNDFFSK